MDKDQDNNRTGRRALFTGTGSMAPPEECIPISRIIDVIQQISTGKERIDKQVSPLFEPILERISDLTRKAEYSDAECRKLTDQLLKSDEIVSGLNEKNRELSSERESYLNDLITSHTEFDRALEIFQYHDVPMVLTGPDNSVHDVNDTFCTLFSIARSEITTSHPPLHIYLPEGRSISGPDGEKYDIITLTPPIVPFDHDAHSLIALIKSLDQQSVVSDIVETTPETIEKTGSHVSADIINEAFEQFPIPAAIINQYLTIIRCNDAFAGLLARGKETIQYRDIGSSGISQDAINSITDVLADNIQRQCSTIISQCGGNEVRTYFEINPINLVPDEPYALIIGVATGDGEEPDATDSGCPDAQIPADDTLIRMLLDLNPAAAALLDAHARVISANEGFSEITGLSPGDLSGTDVRDLGVSIPDSALTTGATEAVFIPGTIRIQSAWGMQESSGMVVPIGSGGCGTVAILILQPINEPASNDVKTALAPDIPLVHQAPDPDTIPIPYLHTDFSGKITRVNKAFLVLTGGINEQFEGHQRDDLIKPESDGIMMVTLPSGKFRVREIVSQDVVDDGHKGYWYIDLSEEIENAIRLQSRINSLESEIREIKDNQQSISSIHNEISLDQIDIVEFELNDERYAIDIAMVREVVEMLPITPLPRTPPHVIGIINLRGEVTHVIDLAILLGQRPKKDRSGQKIMVIPSDVTRGEHVAVIVDNVQSVTEIQGRHVSLLGEDITTQINTHIKGIIKISHDDVLEKHAEVSREATLVIWLDIQKILREIQGTI